jgi:hypothetical protein
VREYFRLAFFPSDISVSWRPAPGYPLHSVHEFHVLPPSKTDPPADLFQSYADISAAPALPLRTIRENKIGLAAVPTHEALLSGVSCE